MSRLRSQDGFTMVMAMLVLLVVTLVSVAAYAAANTDIRLGGYNQAEKRAYAAAQAGLGWYEAQLAKDPSYWMKCTTPPAQAGVTMPLENPYKGTDPGSASRPWRTVSGSTEQYVIDLLPANGTSACDPNNAVSTMIDTTSGTFRIRITGRATASDSAPRRSIIATFRRHGFLDFIYFTDFEDADPAIWEQTWLTVYDFANNIKAWTSTPDPITWINTVCGGEHWWAGRNTATYSGTYTKNDGTTGSVSNLNICSNGEIMFGTADQVAGPFHTNDSIMVCGSSSSGPTFGRTTADAEEISSPQYAADGSALAVRANSGCTSNVVWKGTPKYGATQLTLPPSNNELSGEASPGYTFTGKTYITLGSPSANQMSVTNAAMGLNNYAMTQPSNGVIWVSGDCGVPYDVNNPNGDPSSCGDLYVSGTYDQSLTLGAQKDIIVQSPGVSNSGDVLLGLVANEHVRVDHPSCFATAPNPITIDAAILTVTGSFMVDNYRCQALGTLTVDGVIAQKYRGLVGTNNGATGYVKNYIYDDRLKYRAPPDFLDPVQAGWKVVRITEQSPAT